MKKKDEEKGDERVMGPKLGNFFSIRDALLEIARNKTRFLLLSSSSSARQAKSMGTH